MTMRRGTTLGEVVRAQVAYLFGRFRSPAELTADERGALKAERVDFADRLLALVRAIDQPQEHVVQVVRDVTRQLTNEPLARLPSVEAIAAKVKGSFRAKERPMCFACETIGGIHLRGGDDAPLMPKQRGEVEWGRDGFLCLSHHEALNWYCHREARARGIPGVYGMPRSHDYPAPPVLLPREAAPSSPPLSDPLWESWTDGGRMGSTARWCRAYLKRVHGWDLDAQRESLPLEQGGDPWTALDL